MATLTVKDLRKTLIQNKARWEINPHLRDTEKLPHFHTGGTDTDLVAADKVKPLDFKTLLDTLPGNPWLLRRRLQQGLISQDLATDIHPSLMFPEAMPSLEGGAAPTRLDWRNRWGWPWITTVRDQNGCNACWAFAATALVEAMVRIEHCVWAQLSEGDVHKGVGAVCASLGNPGAALEWIKGHGLADPDCFPWTTANIPYNPTPDKSGRSVRIPSPTNIGSISDQKKWLDSVGPLVTWFQVWTDFFGYGSGVYHKQSKPGNKVEGGHFMLVVGYDDTQQCWIVKNSWGTGWGENGFGRIGYGETEIDKYAKTGLQKVNPDPWTKKRYHNGSLLESGNGSTHRNFEMLATSGHQVRLWWRDNSVSGFPWHQAALFGNDAAACPTFVSTTFNRNFECVYPTTGHRLHHWWLDQTTGHWHDGGIFGPTDVAGVPGFIQGNYNAPGNFEVVVRTADGRLNHWWRSGGWHDGGRFGEGIAMSGGSLIQSHYGQKDNFELVCVLNNGHMQHWWRDNDHGMVWHAGAVFGANVISPPSMIEASFGEGDETQTGNFELCVAVAGGKVEHWWRYNHGDMVWRKSATFGHNVKAVVGLLQGSFGFNLELVVLRTDNKLQHYWRYGATWHEGTIIGSI